MNSKKASWIIALVSCLLPGVVKGTHLRAAEINVRQVDCTSLTFEITVVAYVNYFNTGVTFGGDRSTLSFGDGTSTPIPATFHEVIDDFLKVGKVEFKTIHTYASPGRYTISYREFNRNEGILNYDQSVNTAFYTETSFTIEPGICNTTPILLIPPIDRACKGVTFYHNPGSIDPDNDSLSYELVAPQSDFNSTVVNYFYPTQEKFYQAAGIPFGQANESGDGPPTITIASDGTITWDAPGTVGEYGIAIKVIEWKRNLTDSLWYEVGYVIRDMQIIVEDCPNKKPDLTLPLELCVIAGTLVEFEGVATDPDGDPVVIDAFSDLFSLPESPASIIPVSGTLQGTAPPNDTASVKFVWQTTCDHVKSLPYSVVFKITDRPATGVRLVRFITVSIKVIAPAPVYETVTVNPITKSVHLEWKPYDCDNVREIQIWRRVSRYDYDQPNCMNGMPVFLRYKLIGLLPGSTVNYTDTDLSIGTQYCYRIVALVGNNKTPSRISLDTCLIPKPAEAPVITNISVLNTTPENGVISVRWTSPFDIDKQQYPPPYQYKVYRNDASTTDSFQLVTTTPLPDTTFSDSGLDTQNKIYNYRIELYVPALTSSPVDTSSQAGSVFLVTQPLPEAIRLAWSANTPWYNYSQLHPYHLVYRSNTGDESNFVLIDSVDVNENDFIFIDSGQYMDERLAQGQSYFYKVLTRGTYGNPAIISPLENYSQIAEGQVLDTIPPCQPVLSVSRTDCDLISCDEASYFNTLTWQNASMDCPQDVVGYELLVQYQGQEEFVSLGFIEGNFFTHSDLNSLANCYRLIAVDGSGNKSDSSETVCSENCPYFELPNVFTPERKDDRNDFLTTYTDIEDHSRCPRFVKQVRIKIYDRWGKEVYTTSSGLENNYIFWTGVNNKGQDVSAGIYYYHADILFDMRDPSQSNRQIKGWIHVIR